MGLTILALGIDSVRTGKWIAFGRLHPLAIRQEDMSRGAAASASLSL
jgi:hypothetical protein